MIPNVVATIITDRVAQGSWCKVTHVLTAKNNKLAAKWTYNSLAQ